MEYIVFSNKKLSAWQINVLAREFVRRREIAVDILNPMYEKWNKEFDVLYPGKDGYSDEYCNFLRSKQKDAIDMANWKSIGGNRVQLCLDKECDIFGVCDRWNTTIKFCLT